MFGRMERSHCDDTRSCTAWLRRGNTRHANRPLGGLAAPPASAAVAKARECVHHVCWGCYCPHDERYSLAGVMTHFPVLLAGLGGRRPRGSAAAPVEAAPPQERALANSERGAAVFFSLAFCWRPGKRVPFPFSFDGHPIVVTSGQAGAMSGAEPLDAESVAAALKDEALALVFGKSAVDEDETVEEDVGITVGGKLYRHASEPEQMEKCRYYENEFPGTEDLVMVRVRNVEKLAAYVNLIEYNMAEGMVLLSELSRRRIRSIAKLIRVGRDEVVMVFRVDTEKGYVDLSKRRVTPEDVPAFEAKFNKAKAVHSILRHVAQTCQIRVIDLYTHIAWPLSRVFGHAHDAFKLSITQPGAFAGVWVDDTAAGFAACAHA
jgi:predicted RNA-binding protein with RPS1 domain